MQNRTDSVVQSVTRSEEHTSLEKAHEHHGTVFGQKVALWT